MSTLDIGKEKETITVEPLTSPIEVPNPEADPSPMVEPERVPEPEEVPA